MSFSAVRAGLLLAVLAVTAPAFAQQKGFTVIWSVKIQKPSEVRGEDGKVSRIEPNRTCEATDILGPLKSGEIPPAEMDRLSGVKDPAVFMRLMKDSKVAVPTKASTTKPVIRYAFHDTFIESIPFKGEGGMLTVDGQEGTIDGSGTTTYSGAGNTTVALSYSISKKEYQVWLPFYALFNGKPVDKTYYNFSIDARNVKTVKQPPAFKDKVDPAISAEFRSPNKDEKIFPIFRASGPLPLKINQTVKILYKFPTSGSNVTVPVDAIISILVVPNR